MLLLHHSAAQRRRRGNKTIITHLLVSNAFVSVVQLVGEQLPVARQRLVPAQRHGGRRVGHGLQVGSRSRDLDWEGKTQRGIKGSN